jgi:hypothetical protein
MGRTGTNFAKGLSVFGVPVLPAGGSVPFTGGKYFYVNGLIGLDDPTYGNSPERPFDTIDYAIGKCTALSAAYPKQDVIIVMPGHTETITAAGGIALDVAGVYIVGQGSGSYRPTITYTTAATGTFAVSAANCTVDNIIFNANYADVAKAIIVSGKDCTIKNCLFKEETTNMNFLTIVATNAVANAADGLCVMDCERISIDAAALAFVSILEACNRIKLLRNFDNQSSAADVGHFLIMGAFVCLGAQIIGNILQLNGDNNAQTVGVFATGSSTSSTGVMAYNLVGSLDTTTELIVTAGLDFMQFENYYTGTIATSGKLWPAVDAA